MLPRWGGREGFTALQERWGGGVLLSRDAAQGATSNQWQLGNSGRLLERLFGGLERGFDIVKNNNNN